MVKKILRRTFQILIVAFIIIQFFRPAKNRSVGISNNDITKLYTVPADVQSILKTSCYDCHSNNTIYPWYSYIQPVAWWLNGHIKDGKRGLNFSEFAGYRIRKQYKRLEDINELVKKNEMPPQKIALLLQMVVKLLQHRLLRRMATAVVLNI